MKRRMINLAVLLVIGVAILYLAVHRKKAERIISFQISVSEACGVGVWEAIEMDSHGKAEFPLILSLEPAHLSVNIPSLNALDNFQKDFVVLEEDIAHLQVALCSDEGHTLGCTGKPLLHPDEVIVSNLKKENTGDHLYYSVPLAELIDNDGPAKVKVARFSEAACPKK